MRIVTFGAAIIAIAIGASACTASTPRQIARAPATPQEAVPEKPNPAKPVPPTPTDDPSVFRPPPTGDSEIVEPPPRTGTNMPVIRPPENPPPNPAPEDIRPEPIGGAPPPN